MKKRNKVMIITCALLLIVAIVLFIVGGYYAGWNFKEWFLSPHSFAVYSILGVVILGVAFYLIKEHIKKL